VFAETPSGLCGDEMDKQNREIEAKFFIQDKAQFEAVLRTAGAVQAHELVLEINLRFDTPKGKLERTNQVLRLRKDSAARLTYKSSTRVEGGVFNREEIEVEISDFEGGKRLIEALGFEVAVIYEKYRTTYTLGDLEITVDELPYGDFVEIEGDDPAGIRDCAQRLGLDIEAAIERGYLRLFKTARKKMKLKFRDLTFENFRGIEVSAEQLGVRPADGGQS
jgi:adenylate cyclase class 2